MPETTAGLIAQIRQSIGVGSFPTAEVLRLCDRTEELLASALRMEKVIHDSKKA